MTRTGPARAGWWARPVWSVATLALVALILALPGYLLWDQLIYFHLRGDDFAFLAGCRMGRMPLANLWEPHNAHVVPLFRLLTAGLAWLAGTAGEVPTVLGWASYAALVLLMLGGGHFVAWETRRMGLGLAAMVLLGVTTVIEPAVTWYAAGQTLWAALAVVGVLVGLQIWRLRGGPVRLALAALPALAAPMVWSGGLVAGPAGWAYLRATGDPRLRRAAWVPFGATITGAGIILAFGWRGLRETVRGEIGESSGLGLILRGWLHTSQAIPESLIAQNLGLDVATTAAQGVVFCLALAAVWVWSRRGIPAPNPLEASGAVIVVLGYMLAFGFRGRFPFSSLRGLGWYDTIPQLGAVLFALGWWSADRSGGPGRPSRLSRGEALAVSALAGLWIVLQEPRALDLLLHKAPPLMASEVKALPIKELQRFRARFYIGDTIAGPQRRALARLERAAEIARRRGYSRMAIRQVFGRVEVPGWPETLTAIDALDLLDFPEGGPPANPIAVRAALGMLLATEPPPRPNWIDPDEPWPPPARRREENGGGGDHGVS